MITDDERREVARRLRDKHRERAKPNMFEPQDAGMQLWSYLKDLEDCLPDGDSAFIVLADLIEPTPKSSDIGLTCDLAALVVLARNLDLLALMVNSHELTDAGQIAGTCQNIANGIREALGMQE